jgi:hypothetical protein
VPPLPTLKSTVPEASDKLSMVLSESTPAPRPAKDASVLNPGQTGRNGPGAPESNASPLLKGMFKGRTNTRVKR